MKQAAWCLVVVVLACGGACVKHYRADAFAAPPTAQADVATLGIDPGVRLVSLDGAAIAGIPAEVRNGEMSQGRTVRLLPGAHDIVAGMAPYAANPTRGDNLSGFYTVHISEPASPDDDVLSFTAQPGGRYFLKIGLAAGGKGWRAIVIDRRGPEFETVVSTTTGRVAHRAGGP
jgi:hypothetical protein